MNATPNVAPDVRASFAAAVGGRAALAAGFSARTMRSLEGRADREIEDAQATTDQAFATIDQVARRLGRPELAGALQHEWLGRFRAAWTAYQLAGQRVMNWMVTGPSRFPVERNRKRMETEHNRLTEMLAIARGAAAWAEKRIKRQVKAELGAGGIADQELEAARANLAKRERRQAMMKAANAAIRKHKAKGEAAAAAIAAELEAAGYEIDARLAAELLKPDFVGRVGFADYSLKNNNAEIRRLRGRVAELERRAERIRQAEPVDAAELELDDDQPRIIENAAEDRLQILFPGKPTPAIRDRLKGRGFRWSPRAGAWQRQLTPNAVQAARDILAAI